MVEDDLRTADFIRKMLNHAGYAIEYAKDGGGTGAITIWYISKKAISTGSNYS